MGEENDKRRKSSISAHVPKSILKCRTVSREINFTSSEKIEKFRLEQRVYLKGNVIEGKTRRFSRKMEIFRVVLWIRLCNSGIDEYLAKFDRGSPRKSNVACFIIEVKFSSLKNSREIFSGNVVVETLFYDDNLLVSTSKVRIFYDWRSFIKQSIIIIRNQAMFQDRRIKLWSLHIFYHRFNTVNIYFNNTWFIWNYIVKIK